MDDVKLWHPDLGDRGWVCVRSSAAWGASAGTPEQVFLIAHMTGSHCDFARKLLSRWVAGPNRYECTIEDAIALLERSGFQHVE